MAATTGIPIVVVNGGDFLGTGLAACGYEGYVARDERSVYEGGLTRRWQKVKVPEWSDAEHRLRWVKTGHRTVR